MALLVIVTASSWGCAGCAYFNAMWTAQRHAKDARELERRGQLSEARSQWARAAAKAERVVSRHPRSRWADDALTLQAEGLARSGACSDAAAPIARVRETVKDLALLERTELADAECALATGRHVDLPLALASRDKRRRSRAEYLAGKAAAQRLDYAAASEHFKRSREPAAREELVSTLQRDRIARATARSDLVPVAAELKRLGSEALLDLVNRVLAPAGTLGARLRVAELARDSLQAPLLAGELFLEAAAGDPASVYAPKALLAALTLLPERRDSLLLVLDTKYAASPYTRVLHGEPSIAYSAAEDSLARELDRQVARNAAAPPATGFGLPTPGPRGPLP